MIVTCEMVKSLSDHFGYLENNTKVLASFVLCIACFIQKHPIGNCPIKQFPPILGVGSIMWHLFQTVSAAGWDRFKVSPQPDFFFFCSKIYNAVLDCSLRQTIYNK